MMAIVDKVVSRTGVGRRFTPLSMETTFSHPCARDNKDNNSRERITAGSSANRHLPGLVGLVDELRAAFGPGVTLETLTTPDGTWGADPTEGWPRVNGTDLHRPWQPPRGRK